MQGAHRHARVPREADLSLFGRTQATVPHTRHVSSLVDADHIVPVGSRGRLQAQARFIGQALAQGAVLVVREAVPLGQMQGLGVEVENLHV
jgi:hypothetical protein